MALWIGIDAGGMRTGVAESDPDGRIAFPIATVPTAQLVAHLQKTYVSHVITGFVVGEPKRLDGSATQGSVHADNVVQSLAIAFPSARLERLDERFTSRLAAQAAHAAGASKRVKNNKGLLDAASASLVLQDFLDQMNRS